MKMLPLSNETEELIRAKARAAGQSPEDFLLAAVGDELGVKPSKRPDLAKAREIIERNRQRPVLDPRPWKEILEDAWDLK